MSDTLQLKRSAPRPPRVQPGGADPARIKAALFRSMGADGVYARTGRYERVVQALDGLIDRHRPDGAEVYSFPP